MNDCVHRGAATERTALYRLIEDETQTEILSMTDLDRFFVAPSMGVSPYVRMFGTSFTLVDLPACLRDVELQVIDFRSEVIGAYYIGEVEVVNALPNIHGRGTDLDASFLGYSYPFPYAGQIWRRWASRDPVRLGEWKDLLPEWHQSWLHVVQNAWFQAGRSATRYGANSSWVIDGHKLANIASFYCMLGEVVNGAGGYFGSGLSALADCLFQATAVEKNIEVVWRHREVSEARLGKNAIDETIETFREFGVVVRFPGDA